MPHLRKTLAHAAARFLDASLSRLGEGEVGNLARMIARRRGHDERGPLARFCRDYWDATTAIPNTLEENGEAWLLRATAGLGLRTLFDVGANVGKWAEAALANHPAARIHCFEIVPDTFRLLGRALAPHGARVALNGFGLADRDEMVRVNVTASHLVSSLYEIAVPEGETRRKVESRVRRGEAYAREQAIQAIDLLKIDVEGAENRVLAGFETMLAEARIGLVQFEYNRGAVLGGFLLRHAYEMLTPWGYALGKLTPQGVLFRDYRVEHEDFSGPNYVACHRSRMDLMQLIAAPARSSSG